MTRLAVGVLAVLMACESPPPERPGVLTVVKEQEPAWVRNFNPLIPSGHRWPTRSGVYEPLHIYNAATAQWVPWLARDFEYLDPTTLAFTIRDGVVWSDGTPFEPHDVVFTFELLLANRALDHQAVHEYLDSVEVDGDRVIFRLSRPYSPGFEELAHQPIVPEHVVGAIDDVLRWPNPDPVATGPFTEVDVFRPQVYELGANPHYWQELGVEALRFPAMGSNSQVSLALVQGEIDWAGAFVPSVQRVYADRDPHHGYWFPLYGDTIFLYANAQRPPFDDVRVRKAMSMALDRQLIVEVAMFAYTRPADGTGLSDLFETWRDPDVAAADWVRYDVDRANTLLDDAGLVRGPDGMRRRPDGSPLEVELMVVSGWSDWVRAAQVSTRCLAAVGIGANLRTYDFGAWFGKLGKGEFDLAISWSQGGVTPYRFYEGLMGAEAFRPVGENAGANWQRYVSPGIDPLLASFQLTSEPAAQHILAQQMQRIFAEEAPAIPLFTSPSWGEYNATRFVGWPSADDPYARLSPNHEPDPLLVMTRVRQRRGPEAEGAR